MLSPIFLSHGAPTLPFEDAAARNFLADLGNQIERPKAILMVSAHWESTIPAVNSVDRNATIHDFYGFPKPLYDISYPAPGSPAIAERVTALLADAGLMSAVDHQRGLDHGAWVPLMLAFPDADIPVVQLSVQTDLGPAHHLAMGRAVAPLQDEGVLIIGSGSYTHDLSSFRKPGQEDYPDWVRAFADWFDAALKEGRTENLLAYRALAPEAAHNHPTEEHLLPLYVALGAAGPDWSARHLHQSITHQVLRMDAYAFDRAA